MSRSKINVSIQRRYDNALVLTAMSECGYITSRVYMGYTKREAVKMFKEHVKMLMAYDSSQKVK